MSRDTFSICRACGVYEAGDGLNATLMDRYKTVDEFDADLLRVFAMTPDELPPDHQNRKIRAFLGRHQAHGDGVTYWSNDWHYDEDDPIAGRTPEPHDAGK